MTRRAEDKARSLIESDLLTLERDPGFRRWMGRLAQRCGLTDDLQTNNGGDLQRFMGRRSVAIEVMAEFDQMVPGFLERVLAARRAFAQEILADLKEEEETHDGD